MDLPSVFDEEDEFDEEDCDRDRSARSSPRSRCDSGIHLPPPTSTRTKGKNRFLVSTIN